MKTQPTDLIPDGTFLRGNSESSRSRFVCRLLHCHSSRGGQGGQRRCLCHALFSYRRLGPWPSKPPMAPKSSSRLRRLTDHCPRTFWHSAQAILTMARSSIGTSPVHPQLSSSFIHSFTPGQKYQRLHDPRRRSNRHRQGRRVYLGRVVQ